MTFASLAERTPYLPTGDIFSLFACGSWLSRRFWLLVGRRIAALLIHPGSGDSHRQRSYPRDHSHALGHRNRAAGIENVEQMRTLQAKIVCGEQRKPCLFTHTSVALGLIFIFIFGYFRIPLQQSLALGLAQIKVLPRLLNVRASRSCRPRTAVHPPAAQSRYVTCSPRLRIARPHNVIDRIHILQEMPRCVPDRTSARPKSGSRSTPPHCWK